MVGVVPGPVSRESELPSTGAIYSAFSHLPDSGARVLPLFPVTAPNTSSYPGIKFWNWFPILGEHEVIHPSSDIGIEFIGSLIPRDADTSPRKFTNAVSEFIEGIGSQSNRLSWERKS